jgi:hypothetical protein
LAGPFSTVWIGVLSIESSWDCCSLESPLVILIFLQSPVELLEMIHSVPVVLVEQGKNRWLVAPYGVVDWVKNARASGRVNLSHLKWSEDFAIPELPAEESTRILKKYPEQNPITKPYFDAPVNSARDEFVKEARSRPVFELIKVEAGRDEE